MENQINLGNQNTQKDQENPLGQPDEIQAKSKVNFWMISTLVFALLFLVEAVIFAVNYSKMKMSPPRTTTNQETANISNTVPTSNLKLKDFINKELLGENDNYSVYLINRVNGLKVGGELIVYNRKTKTVIKIAGTFWISGVIGSTGVFNDQKGKYVLLSTGFDVLRTIIPISLTKKTLAVKEFCESVSNGFLFYKDYVIYANCDTFPNRPWDSALAPSLVALNLKTGQEKTIAKSDLTHQYNQIKITGDTLYYLETFVTKEKDWYNTNSQKTITYNLLSL